MGTQPYTETTLPSTTIKLPVSLDDSRITSLPEFAYYIPDFISEDEEQAILHKVSPTTVPLASLRSLRLTIPTQGRDGSQGSMATANTSSTSNMALRSR